MSARIGCSLALVLLVAYAARSAEPGADKTDQPAAEIPAVPYVTLMLVRDPAVHAELRLTPKDVEVVDAAVAEVDPQFWVLRDVPVAQCGDKLDALAKQLRGRVDKLLAKPARQRLDQLVLQARGIKALGSPDMIAQLKLSDDQVQRLRAIIAEVARAGQGSKQSSESTASDREAVAGKVLAILSTDQASQWTTMLGKPFDLGQVRQIGCVAPELRGVDAWINSGPLDLGSQRGRVVAVHFWAFGCINCVHNLPHYQSWHEKFPASKLTIIGIHTPETERERSVDNLRANISERAIKYPVAVDGANENWKAWGNNVWPSVYLVDKQGRVRYWWYGELNWQGAGGEAHLRKKIEELIAE